MENLTPHEQTLIMEAVQSELEALGHQGCTRELRERYKELTVLNEKLNGGVGSIWGDTREKVDDLLNSHSETILQTVEQLFHSGGLDLTQYAHGNWGLAKVLMTVALRQHCDDFYPRNVNGGEIYVSDIKNLMNF